MRKQFKVDEIAAVSGTYRVVHYAHRLPHLVVVLEGDRFPPCRSCHSKVVFEVVSSGTRMYDDRDLQSPAADAANNSPN